MICTDHSSLLLRATPSSCARRVLLGYEADNVLFVDVANIATVPEMIDLRVLAGDPLAVVSSGDPGLYRLLCRGRRRGWNGRRFRCRFCRGLDRWLPLLRYVCTLTYESMRLGSGFKPE